MVYTIQAGVSFLLFYVILSSAGLLSGFLAGLLGVGGGMVLVPLLAFLLPSQFIPEDVVVHVSLGTAVSIIVFTSFASLNAHRQTGRLRWGLVKQISPGLLLGTFLGGLIVHHLSMIFLGVFFSLFVMFSATQMLLDRKPKPTRELPGSWGLRAFGVIVGLLSAMVGAGGGFLSVPFMVWCNVPIQQAIATSAGLGFPIAVFATLSYILTGWDTMAQVPHALGYVYWPATLAVVLTSMFTAPIGARAAHRWPTKRLKQAFALVLYVLASSMLVKSLW